MTTNSDVEKFYVVGIGASAGGLEAIHEMFDNMPTDTGFAFVIVQHLSPDYKSLMPELLAKRTTMEVHEAQDGMALQPNCIYLIPHKTIMTLQGNRLCLTEKKASHLPNTAIDSFFFSLAKEKGKCAVAIILSGTGTDGTKGIEAVKNEGGIVVVQDPLSAKFDGMPASAISTGFADIILEPEMIAEELAEYLKETPLQKSLNNLNQKDERLMQQILQRVLNVTSHDFSNYKRPTIQRRLAKRMALRGIHSLQDYLTHLNTDAEEAKLLFKEFLIGVTKFFRDEEAFDELRFQVLPSLFAKGKNTEPIKIWVVACSTGEEAYSLAILIQEYLQKNELLDTGIKIFATDIDERALDVASKGIYPEDIVAKDVSAERIEKYFVKEGRAFKVSPLIRKMVVFAHHNILKDPPFSRIDLITCRNMLIYMSTTAQKNVLRAFHFAMSTGGFLMLGPSENISLLKDSVKELSKKWKLYKNVHKGKLIEHDPFIAPGENRFPLAHTGTSKSKNALSHLSEIFKEVMVEEYKYAGVYIDREFEVKQAIGNFKDFLSFPDGNFNLSLLKLVGPELSIILSSSLRKAIKDNERIVLKKVKVNDGGRKRYLNIIIKPFLEQAQYMQPFLFVVFQEAADEMLIMKDRAAPGGNSTVDILELENELKETRENLQSAIEELESANEELQSSNEEMIAGNEELQSTNEELQSLNEELHTVNAEHQLKIKELVELNDDLNNYFNNTDIGQLLIDKHLIIRKFSPAARQQINLIESDLGRSIIDISNNFSDLDFVNELKRVMKTGAVLEREVKLNNDRLYQMRISPFVRVNNNIDGVVVNFIDITEIKQLNSIVTGIFSGATSGITAKRAIRDEGGKVIDFEYMAVNKAAENMFGVAPGTMVGQTLKHLFKENVNGHFDSYASVADTGKPLDFEFYNKEKDKWYDVTVVKMMDGIVTTHTEITDKKKNTDTIARNYETLKSTSRQLADTNVELEQSNYDLLQFASVVSHDLKEPLRKIQTFGHLLQSESTEKLNAEEKVYLNKIIHSSFRMKTLIDDLLSYSKLSNKNTKFELVDLNEVIKRIIEDYEIHVKETNAEIKFADLPRLEAIPGQMHQLFQNLISNALKFIAAGEKPLINISTVAISTEKAKEFGIDAKNYISISVTDNGIGFDEKYSEKIFGIFQRVHPGTAYPGTGIGLAICKKIMESNNGFISASSKVGEGSEFSIILPVKQREAASPVV